MCSPPRRSRQRARVSWLSAVRDRLSVTTRSHLSGRLALLVWHRNPSGTLSQGTSRTPRKSTCASSPRLRATNSLFRSSERVWGSFTLNLSLCDGSGNTLGSVNNQTGGVFAPPTIAANGKYFLFVRSPRFIAGGYEITLQRKNNPAGPVAKVIGDNLAGSLTNATEIGVYEFSALAGDHLIVPFARTTLGSFTLSIDLCDRSGNILHSVNNQTGGVFTPPPIVANGRHFLFVRSPRFIVGGYEITLQRKNNPAGSVTKAIGDTFTGKLTVATGIDVYEFSALAGDELFMPFVRTTKGSFTLDLSVCDAGGNVLGNVSDKVDGVFTPPAIAANGKYFLVVRSPRFIPGEYEITLQRTKGFAQPLPVIFNGLGPVPGSIGTRSEIDIYQLSALKSLSMQVKFDRVTLGQFTLELRLLDSNGKIVGVPVSNVSGSLPVAVPRNGVYYVCVRSPRFISGTYTIEVK